MNQLPIEILRRIPRSRRDWILLSLTSMKIAASLGQPPDAEYMVKNTIITDYNSFIHSIMLHKCAYTKDDITLCFHISPKIRDKYGFVLGKFIYKSQIIHLHNAMKFIKTPTDTVFCIYNVHILMSTNYARILIDFIKNELPHVPISIIS